MVVVTGLGDDFLTANIATFGGAALVVVGTAFFVVGTVEWVVVVAVVFWRVDLEAVVVGFGGAVACVVLAAAADDRCAERIGLLFLEMNA